MPDSLSDGSVGTARERSRAPLLEGLGRPEPDWGLAVHSPSLRPSPVCPSPPLGSHLSSPCFCLSWRGTLGSSARLRPSFLSGGRQ